MRQPPAAGPRAVEWMAITHFRPEASSKKAWTSSWPSKAGESNRLMAELATPRPARSQPRLGGPGYRPGAGGRRLARRAQPGEYVGHGDLAGQVAGEQVVTARIIGRAVARLQPRGGAKRRLLGDDVVLAAVEVERRDRRLADAPRRMVHQLHQAVEGVGAG